MLALTDLLDPRPESDPPVTPICDSVRIPVNQLGRRVAELPPAGAGLRVADIGRESFEAVDWLIANDRRAAVTTDFRLADSSLSVSTKRRLWRPAAFVESVVTRLEAERRRDAHDSPAALIGAGVDLACGVGRDAVFAASAGFRMLGVDVLPDAIERADALAERYLLDPAAARFATEDVCRFVTETDERFDLVIVVRFLDRALLPAIARLLRPGGSLVYETFTVQQRHRYDRPKNPSHLLEPEELRRAFGALDIEHYDEDWREYGHTARLWARRF
ncbi:MAG: class I SAM-dependent methyltransferase [Phycisphaerales bacterium]|nr:class I SAM-dependent methyltransferase [Phycisphaerales bacterium]